MRTNPENPLLVGDLLVLPDYCEIANVLIEPDD